MIGGYSAAKRINKFSNEDRGTSLKDRLNDLWIKQDDYHWSDEQVARLIMECSQGRTRTALENIPSEECTSLKCVMRCIECNFYSYAKQTASDLLSNICASANTARLSTVMQTL